MMSYDSLFLGKIQGCSQDLVDAFSRSGQAKYFVKEYYHSFFINDYISPAIDSTVQSYGGAYIDLGRAMTGLPGSVEFYMDYTHTTPAGNQFIAEQMADKVALAPIFRTMAK
jgi:hypothetical protein